MQWSEQEFTINPYTMGALLGGGHLSIKTRVMITTADEEMLEYMRLPAMHRFKKLSSQNSGVATTYLVSTSREDADYIVPIRRVLSLYGLMGKTSHTKFIPDEYKFSSVSQRISLLQGLFDTDGTPATSGCVEYVTASSRLALDVQFIAYSLGGTCTSNINNKWYTKDGKKVGPFISYRLRVKLPKGIELFRLKRKQDKVSIKRQREPYRAVDSVTRVGKGLATCISVSSPNRLFLTRNFVPTHNTVMGLEIARRLGLSTCIIVHKGFLMHQWIDRIHQHMPQATVGIWQKDMMDTGWKFDFVVAMIQSLTSQYRSYPNVLYESYGTVITDEVHRFAAPVWQKAITRFPSKYRLGLTATPVRRDGMEGVFLKHIGPIGYTMKSKTRRPSVHRIFLDTKMKVPRLWNNKIDTSGMVTKLSKDEIRSAIIANDAIRAVRTGRKVLMLSGRLEHIEFLNNYIATQVEDDFTVSKYVGGMKQNKLDKAAEADIIVATYKMAGEALDLPDVDTLSLATPVVAIQQPVGRILRDKPCKKQPVGLDYVVRTVLTCLDYWNARRRNYAELGYLNS